MFFHRRYVFITVSLLFSLVLYCSYIFSNDVLSHAVVLLRKISCLATNCFKIPVHENLVKEVTVITALLLVVAPISPWQQKFKVHD